MRNMQHNKSITNFSEIEVFAEDSETLTSCLFKVIGNSSYVDQTMAIFIKMLPERVLNKAA